MIDSYYGGTQFPPGKMCITIIARMGGSTGSSVRSQGSPGGHTYLAFEWVDKAKKHRHAVYHLVGEREDTALGTGHAVVGSASVEKIVPGKDGKPYASVGGLSGVAAPNLKQSRDDIANDTPKHWNSKPVAKKSVLVDKTKGLKALEKIHKYATNTNKAEKFSLVGANLRLGTNCVTFALDILKGAGVVADWTMYLFSFGSPYQAISRGSLYSSNT